MGVSALGTIGGMIKSDSPTPIKVGVVGLGVETLAGYGKKDDIYRFYEINPTVIDVAKKYFTFLSKFDVL